jgi:hypothetical protein
VITNKATNPKLVNAGAAYNSAAGSPNSLGEHQKRALTPFHPDPFSPVLAAQWANRLVVKLNTKLRQRAVDEGEKSIAYLNQQIEQTSIADLRNVLFKLIEEHTKSITLAKVNEEYALKVIDPAVPPEKKAKPKRTLMVVLGFILGGMLAVLFVFVRRAVRGAQRHLND